MATMYEVLNKFLIDPRRKASHTSLAQDDAYRDLYLAVSRDDPRAVVEPSPSDIKRLASAEARAVPEQAAEAASTKSMVTQMYRKADLMVELKEKAGQKAAVPEGGEQPGPKRPGQ